MTMPPIHFPPRTGTLRVSEGTQHAAIALHAAKDLLARDHTEGWPDKERYICCALEQVGLLNRALYGATVALRELVMHRLGDEPDGSMSLYLWLHDEHRVATSVVGLTYEVSVERDDYVQACRHAWLDDLISEFSDTQRT